MYSFYQLDTLISEEPDEAIRTELQKIILNLLYKHTLGQAQIRVAYQLDNKKLLDNILKTLQIF